MKWVLDLCSGLGGASEAFTKDPHWMVMRIENNEKLAHIPHTAILDVLDWNEWLPLQIKEYGPPALVIAAPPCLEFSGAFNAPREIARREGWNFSPDMSVLEACLDIIDHCRAAGTHWWMVENVMGAVPDFGKYLNEPRQIIGPFVLWGTFPHLNLNSKDFVGHKAKSDTGAHDPLRANKRAKWPIELSEEILEGVNWQQTLHYWS